MVAYLDTDPIVQTRSVARHRRKTVTKPSARRAPVNRRVDEDGSQARAKALYTAVSLATGEAESADLQLEAWRIAAKLKRVCEVGGPLSAAAAADRWLASRYGRCDDELRRALSASLALVITPEGLPAAMTALFPAAHLRLATFLDGGAPYDPDFFAKDLAFGCGFFAPIGPLSLGVPNSKALGARLVRLKKTAGLLLRTVKSGQGAAMAALTRASGAGPWAELHVDTRNLRDFNAEGFERAYRRLAALMRLRPDLAGVYGASWLYDPAVATISPSLDFVSAHA